MQEGNKETKKTLENHANPAVNIIEKFSTEVKVSKTLLKIQE